MTSAMRTSFLRIWLSNLISTFGSQISFVAMPLVALAITNSAGFVALIAAVGAFSRFASGLVAGVVADRRNPRTVMVAADFVAMTATGALVVLLSVDFHPASFLVVLAAVEGSAAVFFAPAEDILVRDVVPAGQLTQAYSWSEVGVWTAGLVGPPVGGLLVATSHQAPFFFNSISYGVGIALLARPFVKAARSDREPTQRLSSGEFFVGFRLLLADRFLRHVTVQVPVHNVALGALSLFTIVRLVRSDVDDATIGLLLAAQGAGALAGTTVSAKVVARLGPGRVFLLNGVTWAILVPMACLLPPFVPLAVALAALWFFAPSQRAALVSYQALSVGRENLGKVRSSSGVVVQVASTVGPFLGAAVATQPNYVAALTLGALTALPVVWSLTSANVWSASMPLVSDENMHAI